MATTNVQPRTEIDSGASIESGVSGAFGRIAWRGIRLPLHAFLMLVAPIARFTLSAAALLGFLASFFFEFSGSAPRFPFWLAFGISLGCAGLVVLLAAVMRRLAR